MQNSPQRPETPPERFNPSGELRKVGVEVEFANLDKGTAAGLVLDNFGGHVEEVDPHRLRIENTRWGRFVVELDTQFAHRPEDSRGFLDDTARELLGDVVTGIVPLEIVCPPIPFDRLSELDPVFDGLRAAGAKGTQESAIYGFGLHLNVEIAAGDVDYLVRLLRAYLLMSDWLRHEIEVDLTRRVLPHANPFPAAYAKMVISPDYRPGLEDFVWDYNRYNPGRNRELDLYPLFAHLAPDITGALADDPLIKARPAFHYRLPNASLSQEGWTAVVEWNRWVEVERLASDPEKLGKTADAYLAWQERPLHERWLDSLSEFLLR